MYIELKTGHNDDGPAYIGKVQSSKSGQTLYFNGKSFKKLKGHAYAYSGYANYYDPETNEEYWISGIKRNGQDRHYLGHGRIFLEKSIVDEYLNLVNFDTIDKQKFDLVDIKQIKKERFTELENKKLKE